MYNVLLVLTKNTFKEIRMCALNISNMIECIVEKNFDSRKNLKLLKTYMETSDCKYCIFFEITKKTQKLWLTDQIQSYKFNITNCQSIYSLSTIENFHKRSGYITMFSEGFNAAIKQILSEIFNSTVTKKERAIVFYEIGSKIYMAHFNLETKNEIGPRLTLELEKIFDNCFSGNVTNVKYNKK